MPSLDNVKLSRLPFALSLSKGHFRWFDKLTTSGVLCRNYGNPSY
jgi:hypothetical protein